MPITDIVHVSDSLHRPTNACVQRAIYEISSETL
jgi:hypothetical protein